MKLSGRTALVTGASSGIGRSVARRLAAEGVRLAVVARRRDLLIELADEIDQAHRTRPEVLVYDLSVRGAADELASAATDALGQVDILVNNAGGGLAGRQTVVGDRDEGREVFDLNVWSPLALIRGLVPAMQERQAGTVVNVTSMMQVMTWPFMGYYTASKAALASFTETLRLELRSSGVHVLEVIPGPVDTPIYAESHLVPGFDTAMRGLRPGQPDTLARRVIRALRRDRTRVIYPGVLRVPYAIPPLVRQTVGVQVGRAAADIDPDDERVLRSGSHGHELARAAREAWERGDRDLSELKGPARTRR